MVVGETYIENEGEGATRCEVPKNGKEHIIVANWMFEATRRTQITQSS